MSLQNEKEKLGLFQLEKQTNKKGEHILKKSVKTDSTKLSDLKDDRIDYSDIPKTDINFWEDAEVVYASSKKPVSIRIDVDIINWFKSYGKGYQTRINEVLKSYMLSVKKRQSP